ncbi:Radical SAM domain protein [Halothermothrix orenii H 168]|uniref:Radical SAM domain protein n=1 Tax=Halothermothrix orenii (strain H 168 / OCM 544 / DSM 9562) TaxID=373903 RepID=B8CXZ5_HALOH|nr:TIGR03960 family B12-binding radical SAM protein [Halothermothrix orenii]ACL70164.1 Radical SAM domain protein [Halothermothrix orenii H 168]
MIVKDQLEKILYRVNSPTRYIGDEWNAVKKEWTPDKIKVAVAFPDVYEIGMSHLGLKIIYHLLNKQDDIICERTYAPWVDMEEELRKNDIPLFSLESKHEIKDFDILGFTLQYEMSYTNILTMIDLAGLPLHSKDRGEEYPLVIGGGSTVFNPEPLAPFFDLFFIGEAETGIVELVRRYDQYKQRGLNREDILLKLSEIPGVYVPSLYELEYGNEGQVVSIDTVKPGVKERIKKQVVNDLDKSFHPVDFIVPYKSIVHDRAVVEIARGCTRGCRFCAAGISYRPVRERKKDTIVRLADKILTSTGYEELSLVSLSTIDYSGIEDLIKTLATRYEDRRISISLPSLRVDRFSVNLAKEVQRVRKSGLTFAPEAGTQRLRDVINKGVKEEDLYEAVTSAFKEGWSTLKLYFMIGLPTETEEDIAGIVKLAKKVLELGKEIRRSNKKKMKPIKVQVSVSTFIPKPFTPFQWVAMDDKDTIIEKQNYLKKNLRGRGLSFSWNDPDLSILEGIFSRGDRRLASTLEQAWAMGCRFDGWNEHFNMDKWLRAFEKSGVDIDTYLKKRDINEILPWDHIDMGVSKKFLIKEYEAALRGETTEDCRNGYCPGCAVCFNLDAKLELVGADNSENQG